MTRARSKGKLLAAAGVLISVGVLAGAAAEVPGRPGPRRSGVARTPFGRTAEGDAVDLFTLTNAHGIEVRAMSYGGIIVSLRVPDREGRLDDVVLGHESLEGYLKSPSYFGAIV
ncbi:MAG: galactose-1-epimerase, partial [Acidobacteria bacterium]